MDSKMIETCRVFAAFSTLAWLTSCDSIPDSYQGKFVSEDGSATLLINADSVQAQLKTSEGTLVIQAAGGVFTGHGEIFDRAREGATGIYIAPSLYIDALGEESSFPEMGRIGWPGLSPGISESKTQLDVYVVFTTSPQIVPPTGIFDAHLFDAQILYLQIDRATTGPVSVLKTQNWTTGVMMAHQVSTPLASFARAWAFTSGGNDAALKEIRFFRK